MSGADLARELRALAASPAEKVVETLVDEAVKSVSAFGVEAAIRSAVIVAYHTGRLAVAMDIFKRSVREEHERIGEALQ